jgi:ribosomal protein S17E
MKEIQIGTVLSKNTDTTEIYHRFQSYFEAHQENTWSVEYIITNEPSKELIAAVQGYYAKVKEQHRKHDEFVERVAKDVYVNPQSIILVWRLESGISIFMVENWGLSSVMRIVCHQK